MSFSEMAATASLVLAAHSTLPEIVGVSINPEVMGTSPARFRTTISLHVTRADHPAGVVAWATAFGAPVRLIRQPTYVGVTTETVRNGHVVVVWNHLDVAEAESLAARLGCWFDSAPGTVLDIDPADLVAVRDHELARS